MTRWPRILRRIDRVICRPEIENWTPGGSESGARFPLGIGSTESGVRFPHRKVQEFVMKNDPKQDRTRSQLRRGIFEFPTQIARHFFHDVVAMNVGRAMRERLRQRDWQPQLDAKGRPYLIEISEERRVVWKGERRKIKAIMCSYCRRQLSSHRNWAAMWRDALFLGASRTH
jgi:hypothetical protein